MRRCFFAPLLPIVLYCAPLWGAADVNKFVLLQEGNKQVGTASYSIETAKNGVFKVHSMYEYKVAPGSLAAAGGAASDGQSGGRRGGGNTAELGVPVFGQFLFEYKVDGNGSFLNGFTQDMTNQKMTSYQPGKQREQLTISQAQGGGIGLAQPITLPNPDYLVMPAFDASSIQFLLTKALEHPTQDKTYLVLIQGPAGRGNVPVYVIVLLAGPATGTLNGMPVALKRYRLNLNKSHVDVFADESGKLMEADVELLATSIVRVGFSRAE